MYEKTTSNKKLLNIGHAAGYFEVKIDIRRLSFRGAAMLYRSLCPNSSQRFYSPD